MMLPDDFENLAQSVVATNLFGNNILQAITTKNYWDVVNEYKPLMHTWYVGLLMQFYIIVPLLLFTIGRFVKDINHRKIVNLSLLFLIGIFSLIMYFFSENVAAKFYYLPYRLYEFCTGGLVFCLFEKKPDSKSSNRVANMLFVITYIVIIGFLFADMEYISDQLKLLFTVILTALLLVLMPRMQIAQGKVFSNKWIAVIGAASFSIFVWHQVILAFIRYSFTNNLTGIVPLLFFMVITAMLSVVSYKYIEQKKWGWMLIGLFFMSSTGMSLYVYKNAGVVRDVPELEVIKGKVHKGMWAEYCDRGYQYDKEFSDADIQKWYVIGNSFGRDMVNIILESQIINFVEVVYSDMHSYQDKKERFTAADVVFLSTLGVDEKSIKDVCSRCSAGTRFFIVGEKNFGENNGQVYCHRFAKDYHKMTIAMEDGYVEKNNRLKLEYCDNYIDMIALVRNPDGKVSVFSEEGLFISQDCRHLTKAGTQYYAKRMDWERFLE